MIAQAIANYRRKRRPAPVVASPPPPIVMNRDIPQRAIVPPLEPTPQPFEQHPRQWTANDEIGRLGEVAANRRAAPLEDVPRWKSALMTILRNLGHVNDRPLAQGESALARIAGNVAGSGITGFAVPGIEGQARKDVNVAQAEQDYQRAIEAQKQVVGIETGQSMNRRREAEIPYLEGRPERDRERLESIDTHRDESRILRREANESLNDYRNRTLGQRQDANESTQAYRTRMADLRERGLTEQERHNQASEAIGQGNVAARQEGLGLQKEGLGLRKEGLAIQQQGVDLRSRKANTPRLSKAQKAAQRVPGVGVMTAATSPQRGALPKLSEAQIRAAAAAKGLDPAKAIAKARARGQL